MDVRRTALILTICSSVVGCGGREMQDNAPAADALPISDSRVATPEETVRTLVGAYLGKRLGEYYNLVATVDKEVKSLEDLQAEFAPNNSDLVTDYLFQFTRFRVDSSSVEGDTALVYVTSTAPDIHRVMREAAVVERSIGPETDLTTKLSLLNERLRLAGGARVENQATYFLVREPAGWRAVVGWADLKEFEQQLMADSVQAGGT